MVKESWHWGNLGVTSFRFAEARAAWLKVWLDENDLEPGRGWQEQLERGIEELCTAFAVYLGASGVLNWVGSEVRLAVSRARRESGFLFIRGG